MLFDDIAANNIAEAKIKAAVNEEMLKRRDMPNIPSTSRLETRYLLIRNIIIPLVIRVIIYDTNIQRAISIRIIRKRSFSFKPIARSILR